MTICPICKGTGKFELPKHLSIDAAKIKKRIVKELHLKGYSIRQIQKAMEYKSPHSVDLIVKQK